MSDIKVKQVNLQKILSMHLIWKLKLALLRYILYSNLEFCSSLQKLLIKVCKFQFLLSNEQYFKIYLKSNLNQKGSSYNDVSL